MKLIKKISKWFGISFGVLMLIGMIALVFESDEQAYARRLRNEERALLREEQQKKEIEEEYLSYDYENYEYIEEQYLNYDYENYEYIEEEIIKEELVYEEIKTNSLHALLNSVLGESQQDNFIINDVNNYGWLEMIVENETRLPNPHRDMPGALDAAARDFFNIINVLNENEIQTEWINIAFQTRLKPDNQWDVASIQINLDSWSEALNEVSLNKDMTWSTLEFLAESGGINMFAHSNFR